MLDHMRDCAHDAQHVYRVLYLALRIARAHIEVDSDVLITACLLHDIGRAAQFADPSLDHAREGARMAKAYLVGSGFEPGFADAVADCIRTHRYRSGDAPASIEAKILFDADKLDVTGAIGIARTLIYQGIENIPLYQTDEHGNLLDGTETGETESFMSEYVFKLSKVYDHFHTREAAAIATKRRALAESYYRELCEETRFAIECGRERIEELLVREEEAGR